MEELKTAEAWAYYLSDELQLDPPAQETLIYDLRNGNAEDWIEILEDEEIDSFTIGDFCNFFKLNIPTIYTVELSFNENTLDTAEIDIEADYGISEEDIENLLYSKYEDKLTDLLILEDIDGDTEIDENGESWYLVNISLNDIPDTITEYVVKGADEDDAIYEAMQEAIKDISLVAYIYKRI